MSNKSLGQIYAEAFAGYKSYWASMLPGSKEDCERGAQAVAAHVRDHDAKQAVPLSAYQQVEKEIGRAHV